MIVRILNSNTHAGQGLREGGLKQCAVDLDADIVVVQEVQRPSARQRLRTQFPRQDWGIFGLWPPSIGPSSAGNHVLWKKSMFKQVGGDRELISRQLFINGKRDKWHPTRRLCQARLKSTDGKNLAVGSDHLWTTAGHTWKRPWDTVVAGHRRQARRQAEIAWTAQTQNYKVVHLGDENEGMAPGDDHESYMELQYQTHGMVPARHHDASHVSLDAAYVCRDVDVVSFDWIPKHLLTTDHDGILLVVDI